jgi:ADP-ribose pyrophosphatase YjhB (NUDIX family)
MSTPRRHYCHICGGGIVRERDDEGTDRDYCRPCGRFFYENPLPVVSAIVTMDRWLLFVRRGKRPYRGLWCLPTGFAESGESIEEAVLRELEEEAGIKGKIAGLVDVDSYRSRFYGDLLFLTFEVEQTGGILRPGSDTTAVRYYPPDDLPRIAFPSNRKAIGAFVRSKSDYWAIVDSFRQSVGEEPAEGRRNLLSDRLVEVIEENAESIARMWMKEALTSRTTAGYHLFGRERLFGGVLDILSRFSAWLGGVREDAEVKDFFSALGRQSRREGVPLSHVLSSLSLVKKHLWEFALSRGMWQKTLDIYMALELDRRIVIFFDRAVFHATQGYESREN